jgi:hypothetical protein
MLGYPEVRKILCILQPGDLVLSNDFFVWLDISWDGEQRIR